MAINFGLLNANAPAELGATVGNALALRRQRDIQDQQLLQQQEQFRVQNALANMQLQKAQSDAAEEEAFKNAAKGYQFGAPVTPDIFQASPTRALALQKQVNEAERGKVDTQAKLSDMAHKTLGIYREQLVNVNTPEQFAQWLTAQHNDPALAPIMSSLPSLEASLATIPQDPRQFQEMKMKAALGLGKFMEMNKPTDFERTMDVAGLTPEQRQAAARQRLVKETTHAPGAVTNVNMALEREEQKAKGKSNVELYGEVRNAASIARKLDAQLESQSRILDRGFDTGFGTETKAAAASVLGAMGVKDAEKFATDAQTFTGAAKEVVLQKQLAQKGPQTESDAKRIEQTSSQLGNTSAANRFLIDVARAQNAKDIGQQRFFDDYWRKNGTYEGAENAWYSGEGGKSIFEDRRMKKYEQAQSGRPGSNNGPTVGAIEGGYRFRGGNPSDPKSWEKVQ